MRRLIALTTILALSLTSAPLFAAGATRGASVPQRQVQTDTGTVTAIVKDSKGQILGGYVVRIRNLADGSIAGSTTSDREGKVTFTGLKPGNYTIEIVNDKGGIVGTSASIAVAAGATVSVGVSASAAALAGGIAAAGGAGAAAAGLSTAAIVGIVAAGAAIATVVVVKNNASPSR